MNNVSERMREDWNQRALEDPHYYVAFGSRDQDEEGFLGTAHDVLRYLETELNRFPKGSNRRAWRALEIGCGPGRLMKPFSRNVGEIHGVDVSDEMIALARQRLRDIPHAHVHATNGASLAQFADESFDFVYSYAVFQHIPSRDVVLEYMRETRRVLKPGGIFRGQFNGLPHSAIPDTWSGIAFSAEDIRAFTIEHGFQLLNLEGVDTQYLWTTWRKETASLPVGHSPLPTVRRVTNAYSFEPVAPNRERYAAISLWMRNLPDHCDLNNLEVRVDGADAPVYFVGWPIADGIRQVNAWLPPGIRTGLLPVDLLMNGQPLCPPGTARLIPPGQLVPRIVSLTDGVNLVQKNASSSGILKAQIEEIESPESLTATVGDQLMQRLELKCIDPRAPRYEVNMWLPKGLSPGRHKLLVSVGNRRLSTEIDFRPLTPPNLLP